MKVKKQTYVAKTSNTLHLIGQQRRFLLRPYFHFESVSIQTNFSTMFKHVLPVLCMQIALISCK